MQGFWVYLHIPYVQHRVAALQEALHHIPAMLDSLAVCARFPQDSCNYALTAQDATEAVPAEEETATVLEKRQDLFTLFKNTAKLVPEPAYVFVGKQLQGVVSRQKAEWQVSIFHKSNRLSGFQHTQQYSIALQLYGASASILNEHNSYEWA